MSYEQYWHGDVELYWAYQVAYHQRLQFEQELENNVSWLRGLYNYQAFATVYYNANKRPQDMPMEYFENPIEFDEQRRILERKRKQEQFDAKMKAVIFEKKLLLDKRKKEQ